MGMKSMRIVCPNCNQTCEINSERDFGYCSFCGHKIFIDKNEQLVSFLDYKNKAYQLVKNKEFASLKELAITMIGKWSNNFWSYCFLAIADSEINLIDGLHFNAQVLTKSEINQDMKSRIYFAARKKYVSSSLGVFNSLSKYYPDIPSSDGNSSWQKCPTAYEKHQAILSFYLNAIELINTKYLQKLENLAENEEEYNIILSFKKWEINVNNSKKDLDNFNKEAQAFVNDDFLNTPKPGNNILFNIFLSLFGFTCLLLLTSIVGLIYGIMFGFLSTFTKIFFVVSSCFMIGIVSYFILSKKLFYSFKVIYSILLIISVIMVIVIGANGVFFARSDNGYAIFFFAMSIAFSLFMGSFSLIIFIKNRTRKTNKIKTYIGDLDSLYKNNFEVDFNYEFKKD